MTLDWTNWHVALQEIFHKHTHTPKKKRKRKKREILLAVENKVGNSLVPIASGMHIFIV